jgi:cytochrome c-type biogenesis protein CcmH
LNRINKTALHFQGRFADWHFYLITAVVIYVVFALPALAQDSTPGKPVTADDINAVAKQMYCPVCENIPLDVCPTDACQQWREEIGTELAAGKTPDEIKSSFVARYGDRVVGTPEDPTLRALSLITPPAIAVIAIIIAGWVVFRWRQNRQIATKVAAPVGSPPTSDDDYRARLEQDLLSRR